MKWLSLCILILGPCMLVAQGTLERVSVTMDLMDTEISIKQRFVLDAPDSIQSIHLKALQFEGTVLSKIAIEDGQKEIVFKEEDQKGLQQLKLRSITGFKTIDLSYRVQVGHEKFYLPLFFTELPAATSDNDFFKMEMHLSKTQGYTIYFPGVPIKEQINGEIRTLSMEVPALPSMVRMELFKGDKGAYYVDYIDMTVALLFVGIGLLIWKYRKHLIYG